LFLVTRTLSVIATPQVGLAPVELKEQGSKNNSAVVAWALLLLFLSLFDSLLVSSGKNLKASVRDAAELDTSAGFSPVDLGALDPAFVTTGNTPTVADTLGLGIVANDLGYLAPVQMGTPPRDS
jgi:hypothetical protein